MNVNNAEKLSSKLFAVSDKHLTNTTSGPWFIRVLFVTCINNNVHIRNGSTFWRTVENLWHILEWYQIHNEWWIIENQYSERRNDIEVLITSRYQWVISSIHFIRRSFVHSSLESHFLSPWRLAWGNETPYVYKLNGASSGPESTLIEGADLTASFRHIIGE